MRVTVATYADDGGGADRAAYRIHRCLVDTGVDARMLVDRRTTSDPTVVETRRTSGPLQRIGRHVGQWAEAGILELQRPAEPRYRSIGLWPGAAADQLVPQRTDLVSLHWPSAGFLSIRQIGRLPVPTVWTLHTLWAIAGAEHSQVDGPDARWREPYRRVNRPPGDQGLDVDRWTWRRKARHWRHPRQLVSPSRWLAGCVAESALLGDWPCAVIPYPLPIDRFRPHDGAASRRLLGMPETAPIVLFGAAQVANPNKGWDLMEAALGHVARERPDAHVVVMGDQAPQLLSRLELPVHYLGYLRDPLTLALAYSAADVVVMPSRLESFGQMASEALGCGTPVVAFETTGLRDVVLDRRTGYLATPFDPADLARGITWLLEDRDRRAAFGHAARERAEREWAPQVIGRRYQELFAEVLDREGPQLRGDRT